MQYIVILLCIILSGCGESGKTESAIKDPAKNVADAAKSFYDWYIAEVQKKSNAAFDALVAEGHDGKCKLDIEKYFNLLRKLGTVSEKFIDNEKKRLAHCAEFLATVSFSDFVKAGPYAYANDCPFFYYYHWLNSPDYPKGMEVKQVSIKGDSATARLEPYNLEGDKKIPAGSMKVILTLENEKGKWGITAISFEKENSK